ncbi:50S ribosomal protein L31e [Candidatus Pacearchaeota archaeon]|nr:50S ribosomal protein L31e [Candidatus Pacearchaeota archaeon]
MAEKTVTTKVELEREYIIPLRNEWRKGANYERAGKAIKTIKKFIAKHMKVSDRDVSKVKLDQWLNQEVWFKGKKKPPARIKVRAIKESNGMVRVELAELPEFVKFEKAKKERLNKPSEKPKVEEKKEEVEKKEEKTEEQKKDEKEKEQSVADFREREAKQESKSQKHLTKAKDPGFHRMALKK